MPKYQCIRKCFWQNRLWSEGEVTEQPFSVMPKTKDGRLNHFVEIRNGIPEVEEAEIRERVLPKDTVEEEHKPPVRKYISQMAKAELIEKGKELGLELTDEMTKNEMLKRLKEKMYGNSG